jgi:CII-binding regulator of phage lambda lysogenization HflD
MADVIDDLKVQIDASTNSADAKIDKFIQKMVSLQSAISGIEMSGASQVASGINQIASSIQSFNERTKTTDFSRVTGGLNKLGAVDIQGVSNTAHAMESFANSINGIGNLKFDTDTLTNIANSISKLGRTSVTEATQNLEFLKTSVADFVSGMNNVGSLIFNPDSLYKLVSSISRLGGLNATQAVQNLPQISTHLHSFVSSMNSVSGVTFNIDGLNSLVNNISRLGGAKATQSAANLKPIKDQILRFVSGLNGIGALNFDTSGLANLVASITKFGGKSAVNAIPNIQALGVALKSMMQTLSGAPAVNKNLIQMTNALANLASNGSKVSSASHAMTNSLNSYSNSAGRAKGSTKGLVSQIGMLYAKYFLLVRGIKGLWKATESSMDYIETLNYFDAAWGQVADNAIESWKQSGYDSAEAYADSFSKRAQDLTGKMSGFKADNNGNLISTGMPSLGIDPDKVMNYQATFGQMASSMGVASETALQLSNALTMIGADLASVKNLDFEDVWNDMASGMVGMSRTLDKYGVNIRNVNLQEKLHELGIKTKITALNQQDKALLRTMILLDSTRYAWGDLSNTLGQPANQLRLLQANFANLARTIGNLFLPIVATVLPYINALVIAVQRLFTWIGSLLGIKIGSLGSSVGSAAVDMDGLEDAAGGVADKMDDAADKSKKMASNLQSFDNLNVINSKDSSSGSGSGGAVAGGGLLDEAFLNSFSEYQAAWDKAFSNMENSAQNMADKIENAFKRVWEAAEPTREALSRLWNEGFAQLGNFTWTALQDFWSNFLVPLGKWTLGTGFPMFIDCINNFLMKIDFQAINVSLKNFWQALEPFAEKVGEGLIRFFGDLLSFGSDFINAVVPGGLNGIAEALRKISPEQAEKIGYALGVIATALTGMKVIGTVATSLETIFKIFGGSSIVKGFGIFKGGAGIVENFALKLLNLLGIGKLLLKFTPFSTLATDMALSGASLPTLLKSLILTPIITFFTSTLPTAFAGLAGSIGSSLGLTGAAAVTAGGAIIIAAIAAVVAGIVYAVTHWDEIKEFWTQKVPAWWNGTVLPFFESIPEKLTGVWDKVKSTASSAWDKLIQYLSGIPEKVGVIVENIGNWFSELPGRIGYALGYALGTITKWGIEVADYMAKKIPEIVTSVVIWFSEMPGKIYNAIATFAANVVTWGVETYTAFQQKVSEIIAGVVIWFTELPGKIYDTIIKIKDNITTWANNTIQFFKTEVPVIIENVVGFFEELPKQLITVGENMIKGLWNGIANLTDWIGTNIANFCEGVIKGFKAGFDEHSPSKEAFQIGDYFTVGLMNGIEDKFSAIYSKVDAFADNLTDYRIALPSVDSGIQVNREFFDMVDTSARVSFDNSQYDFRAGISAELNAALSGIIDYDRLGNILAEKLESAKITAELDSDKAYSNVKDKWKREYSRNKTAPVPI